MKIIHWEFNEQFQNKIDSASPKMAAGLMRNSDTDKPTGVWFRWTYLLQSGRSVFLHCVGQDSYKVNDIPGLALQDLNLLLYISFDNFKRVFLDRMDLINLEVDPPVYKVTDEMMQPILDELNQQLQ